MIDRQKAERQVLEKAAQDPQFRARLLEDAPAAIAREFGVKLPPGSRITALEERPDQHYLILPLNPEKAQLGPVQLDSIAAGTVDGCYGDCHYDPCPH